MRVSAASRSDLAGCLIAADVESGNVFDDEERDFDLKVKRRHGNAEDASLDYAVGQNRWS